MAHDTTPPAPPSPTHEATPVAPVPRPAGYGQVITAIVVIVPMVLAVVLLILGYATGVILAVLGGAAGIGIRIARQLAGNDPPSE